MESSKRNREITFSRIVSVADKNYNEAQQLYHASFPECEKRTELKHREALGDSAFFCYTIYIGDQFAGILYFWQWDNFSFIEHLATNPEIRGGGIGGLALEKWKQEQQGRVLLLEIEPPTDQLTTRRQAFYTRHGFITNHHYHLHPSYSPTTAAHELLVMSAPGNISTDEFAQFRKYTLQHILSYVEK